MFRRLHLISFSQARLICFGQIAALSLLIAILSSCSHTKNGDGPPNFYVDETKIPNAVPKPEPLSKFGNLKSYVVFGKRYHTLSSSKHYEAIGLASWYGKKFHARRTSSGERYDMLGMTAAHKTLPLPTYVEVTNLRNQRKVIVKINDRGPFASNRIIDLSYVAAKKLGMIGHGTAPVKIRAINPYSYGSSEPFFAKHTHGRFYASGKLHPMLASISHQSSLKKVKGVYLKIGSFRNKSYAQRLKNRLDLYLSTPVSIHRQTAKSKLYQLRIGPIKNMASAAKIKKRLHSMGIYSPV